MKLPQRLWQIIYDVIKAAGHARASRTQGLWY